MHIDYKTGKQTGIQTQALQPFRRTVRFNLSTVRHERLGYYKDMNNFIEWVLLNFFNPQPQYIIADLNPQRAAYLHTVKTNFTINRSQDIKLKYLAQPPHFYTRPTGFAQTVTVNHLWQRYRYVYLNEESVPYDEGQDDLCTCVWEVPPLHIDVAESPEL